MFTGIVEETGAIEVFERSSAGARVVVAARTVLDDLQIGGSVAVNGCCLTAVALNDGSFCADLSPETLDRTNLGRLRAGAAVNLERPLSPAGRLSGHFVQGHVDGTGEVASLASVGDGSWWLSVKVPEDLRKYLVFKGSIAIDGISLTLASVSGSTVGIAVIPHTYEVTNLRWAQVGSPVNIECDMLAKHVHRLLALGSLSLEAPGSLS